MVKNHYAAELQWQGVLQPNGNKLKTIVVQEWLTLWYHLSMSAGSVIEIDGDFGNATFRAVKKFQKYVQLPQTGVVDSATFKRLSNPLAESFDLNSVRSADVRNAVLGFATLHLQNAARELSYLYKGKVQGNMGPWVRSYCNAPNAQGEDYAWCLGFTTAILDLAYSKFGLKFTANYKNTLGCDQFGEVAHNKGLIVANAEVRQGLSKVRRGDMFMVRETPAYENLKWEHIGIIKSVNPDGTFNTIEGNSNYDGSRNGWGVVSITRNFHSNAKIYDVVKLVD